MNERTKKLIDDLENSRLSEFNMETFADFKHSICGSPCCIAGHCAMRLAAERKTEIDFRNFISDDFILAAVEFLEISKTTARALCQHLGESVKEIWGSRDADIFDLATQPQAAQAIRRAIKLNEDAICEAIQESRR